MHSEVSSKCSLQRHRHVRPGDSAVPMPVREAAGASEPGPARGEPAPPAPRRWGQTHAFVHRIY